MNVTTESTLLQNGYQRSESLGPLKVGVAFDENPMNGL